MQSGRTDNFIHNSYQQRE